MIDGNTIICLNTTASFTHLNAEPHLTTMYKKVCKPYAGGAALFKGLRKIGCADGLQDS